MQGHDIGLKYVSTSKAMSYWPPPPPHLPILNRVTTLIHYWQLYMFNIRTWWECEHQILITRYNIKEYRLVRYSCYLPSKVEDTTRILIQFNIVTKQYKNQKKYESNLKPFLHISPTRPHKCTHLHSCMHTDKCTHTHACTHIACVHTYSCTCTCMHIHMHIHACMHAHSCMHMHAHTSTYKQGREEICIWCWN